MYPIRNYFNYDIYHIYFFWIQFRSIYELIYYIKNLIDLMLHWFKIGGVTYTQTFPHGALLKQRFSSYDMSFLAMLCHAPNDQLSRNTIREGFVPSSPMRRTLKTPHVGDFFLLQFCSAVRLRPGHERQWNQHSQ